MTDISSIMDKGYLSNYMNKVSRSFALVAPQIESPLSEYLAVAYLICRVADNIEDCTAPFYYKQARFAEFTSMLDAPELAEEILGNWERMEWPGLSADEIEMMTRDNGMTLWQIYAGIPVIYRSSINEWAKVMASGMEMVTNLDDDNFFTTRQEIRLPLTAVDYNRYCFYVAGTVGRMITEIIVKYYGLEKDESRRLLSYSETCGRALQKTNIIKDFAKDLARGDSFLPDEWMKEVDYTPLTLSNAPEWWKKKVLLDVLTELDNSVNYIVSLPETAVGYRRASLLMMLPAYQTLLLAAKRYKTLFTSGHAVKISRVAMGKCMIQAQMMAVNDESILNYSRDLSQQIKNSLDLGIEQSSVNRYKHVSG